MAMQPPSEGDIRRAKINARGGARKRCKKGKNCSAACIDAGEVCLVELPEGAAAATTKVRDLVQKRVGGTSATPVSSAGGGGSSKPYEVAVTQGRFNIPHLGHVKMIQEMLEKADTAHVLIGKGKDNIDQDLRSQMLRAALRHEGVDLSRVKLIKQENMMPYASGLSGKFGSNKTVAVLGEDQDKFLSAVGKNSKVDTHLVPRGPGGASSTKIRQMIASGDVEGLKKAYDNNEYLMRLAKAAYSVEKNPEKWGAKAKEKAATKAKAKPKDK